MKKYKIIVPAVAVCIIIAVLLTFRLSLAYLMDAEVRDNVITIGKVSLTLNEDQDESHPYENSQLLAAGDSIIKAPKLINDGTEDEYVFLSIAVPVENVTLLYETNTTITGDTHKEGTKVHSDVSNPSQYAEEIFRMIATTSNPQKVDPANGNPADDTHEPVTAPCLDFGYNAGHKNSGENGEMADTAGWVYLYRKLNQPIRDSSNETKFYNVYYFGYNKRLKYDRDQAAQDTTVPLFDRVQLKSYIDQETVSKAFADYTGKIIVTGYGIQADSLDTGALRDLPRDAVLDQTTLDTIFGIVQRKAGAAG